MNNFHCGDSDHRATDDGQNFGRDARQPLCDMANPMEVRQAFLQNGHGGHAGHDGRHGHHGGHGHAHGHGNGHGELEFDNPYGNKHKNEWHCQNGKDQSTDVPPTTPPVQQTTDAPVTSPTDAPATTPTVPFEPAVPTASISELTQLSEQMLPVHHNGSYPAVADWENLHAKNVQKATDAAQAGSNLVMFGDSITEAMGWNPAALEPFNQAFGADKPTALGVGGDGTQQLLYRLNHGEMQGHPDTAMVMIGTNDIGSLSTEQIAQNTSKIIESIQARSPQTKIVLMGILPRPDAGDPGNTKVDETNEALSHLATANGAVQFTNLRNSFVDANGNEKAELYADDKLHLSPAGYQVWADGVKSAVEASPATPQTPAVPTDGAPGGAVGGANGDGSGGTDSGTGTGVIGGSGANGDGAVALDVAGIRGVNLSGAEWGKNGPDDGHFWPTSDQLDYYKSKGMNTVRLMISWEQFQPSLNGPLDSHEMARLDDFLHAADQRGMKVLVTPGGFDRYTLNHGPYGQGVDGETQGTVIGQPGVPVSAFSDFWTKMVQHVDADASASRAVGGWDLINEPFDTNGSWAGTATAVDQAIRATGDNHTVVVEGDQWARDFTGLEGLAKLDKNVAFEAHSYWDGGSGGYGDQNPPTDANVGVRHIQPFVSWLQQNDAKGFVGEWGVPSNNTAWDPAITNFINYLDDNHMGNMVWAGGRAWDPNYTLNMEPINGQDRAIMPAIIAANES